MACFVCVQGEVSKVESAKRLQPSLERSEETRVRECRSATESRRLPGGDPFISWIPCRLVRAS